VFALIPSAAAAISSTMEESVAQLYEAIEDHPKAGDTASNEGKIVQATKKLADELSKLVKAYSAKSKRDLIVSSRNVSSVIEEMAAAAEGMSANTSDTKQKDLIISAAVKVKRGAVNLKVSTAMSAASSADEGKGEIDKNTDRMQVCLDEIIENTLSLVSLGNLSEVAWSNA